MNTQSTLDQLKTLKLTGMAQAYQGLISMPVHDQLNNHRQPKTFKITDIVSF
jgi:hypothetical protein